MNTPRAADEPPPEGQVLGNYRRTACSGDLIFVSGHTSRRLDGSVMRGVLGLDVDVETGRRAAALAAENIVDAVRRAVPDGTAAAVSVRVFLGSTADLQVQTMVADSASAVPSEVSGALHARTAVSVPDLPGEAAVEVGAVFLRTTGPGDEATAR